MKPINSKEKSKQLWQFVIIFLGLAVVPVALIFFSYYKVPDEISEAETHKLVDYSHFEHRQKQLMAKLVEIDSNINKYAEANTENPKLLDKKILDGLSELSKMDTSIQMLPVISAGYEKHYTHVTQLVQAQQERKDAMVELQKLQENLKEIKSNPMMGSGAMPMPPGTN